MTKKTVKSSESTEAAVAAGRQDTNVPGPSNPSSDDRARGADGLVGARVLLVEDNMIERVVAEDTMKAEGIVVVTAENGRQAIDALQDRQAGEKPVNAILLNVNMSETEGFHTARTIREDPRFDAVPIIAMAPQSSAGFRETCFGAGMNDCIAKPIGVCELNKVLARHLAAGTDPGEFPDTLPGVDIELGIKRLGGNPVLFKKLLRQFAEDYHNLGTEVAEAIERKEYGAAKELVHGIKGVAGNLSTQRLFSASTELDAALNTRTLDSIPELAREFYQALDEVIDSISQKLTYKATFRPR